MSRTILPVAVVVVCAALLTCNRRVGDTDKYSSTESPYLLLFAGDGDEKDSDFFAVMDLRPGSATVGRVISTTPVGMRASMPHHMEYKLPPKGELLFVNAHHHEQTMLVNVSDPHAPRIVKTFAPPAPFRYPHDYTRTPAGTRLIGFLRSEGKGPDPADSTTPGSHGGIAEYTADGKLLRQASAGVSYLTKAVRPYAFAVLPEIDRLVVTSAPMMESSWADVVQIYRYSDFSLLKTLELPPGRLRDGTIVPGSHRAGFGPRVLADRSVFLNSYGCAFYRLSHLDGNSPQLENVLTLETPEPPAADRIRGSCGIPVIFDHYWLMPAGQLHAVVVLDITDPSAPREVFRLPTPRHFNPHWLARDPGSNRLVLGAEFGGEEGFYLLRFNAGTGQLEFDTAIKGEGQLGYLSLKNQPWPHGPTGPAWGHAALFMPPK